MSKFKDDVHKMFDHIWDTEIDYPVFQDTVGELMEGVFPVYDENMWYPPACKGCANNPANGGSGICHCTLGTQTIY